MRSKRGFTLIELVMVILILGLLAVVAVPIFTDYSSQATDSAELGVVGGVRAGITAAYLQDSNNPKQYPAALDSASNDACSTSNVCFDNVLSQGGITQDWTKATATTYTGPTGSTYTYTVGSGTFLCTAGSCP